MHQVRKWHFSDAPPAAANDRFRRKSGPRKFHVQRGEQCCCCSWNDGFGMSALEVRADAASKSAVSQERCHPILSQIQIGDAQPGRSRAPTQCRLSKELVICQIQCHPTVHACPDETRVAPKSTEHVT
jgi:hypothetical protein